MYYLLLFVTVATGSVSLGRFNYNHHGLGGEVIVLNDRQYRIKGFSYDGQGPAVWHIGMRKNTIGVFSEGAYAFRNENQNCNRLGKKYSNRDVVITLPSNLSITRDIETIAVFCFRFCHNFGHVKVPKNLRVPAAPKNLRNNADACRPNHQRCSRDRTRDNAVCELRNGAKATCPVDGGGGGSRDVAIRRGSSPQPLGYFTSYASSLSGHVTILNDKQIRIKGFNYPGGKNVYFMGMEKHTVGVYNVKGFAFPDENGKCNGLKAYRNRDITISVKSVRELSAVAVYDYENCVNLGHIRIGNVAVPDGPNTHVNVCLPFFRPCSRRDTQNDGVCRDRFGEYTC